MFCEPAVDTVGVLRDDAEVDVAVGRVLACRAAPEQDHQGDPPDEGLDQIVQIGERGCDLQLADEAAPEVRPVVDVPAPLRPDQVVPVRERSQSLARGPGAEPGRAGDLADKELLAVPPAEMDEEAPAGSGDDVRGAEHMFVYANDGGMNLAPGSERARHRRGPGRLEVLSWTHGTGAERNEKGATTIGLSKGPAIVTAIINVQPCYTECCATGVRYLVVRIDEMPRICLDRIGEAQQCRQQRCMAARGSARRRLSISEIVVRVLEETAAPVVNRRSDRESPPAVRTSSRTTCHWPLYVLYEGGGSLPVRPGGYPGVEAAMERQGDVDDRDRLRVGRNEGFLHSPWNRLW